MSLSLQPSSCPRDPSFLARHVVSYNFGRRCAGAAGGGLEVRDEELVEAQAAEAWVDDLLGGGEQFPGL